MTSGDRSRHSGQGHHGHDTAESRPIVQPKSPRQALVPERMPPPPSRRARHPLVIAGNALITGIVLLMIAGGIGLYFGMQKFEAPGPLDRERAVIIPPRSGVRDIAELLRREGVIEQPLLFFMGAVVMRATGDLKAGEYLFDRQASMRQVIDALIEGKSIQHQVTIAEGLTSEQIVQKLLEADMLTGVIREIPKDGTLLPETYKVTRGTTREQMINRMAAAHRRLLQEVWERRAPDLPFKTPQELITLASIVEKETGKADERSRVAAVFFNRLNRRMRLQSDPTIIYGLVGGKGTLGRPLQREDVERPTPYNTYVIEGMPPGPIANPGRASLEAVANPSRTKELYFVADGTGGHVFAETYDQHLRNVARWRQYRKEDAAASSQPAQSPSADPGSDILFSPAPAVAPPAPPPAKASKAGTNQGSKKAAGKNAKQAPKRGTKAGSQQTGPTDPATRTQ